MTDTFTSRQVDRSDLPAGEEDSVVAIAVQRPDGKTFAGEGPWHSPHPSLEGDVVVREQASKGLSGILFFGRGGI